MKKTFIIILLFIVAALLITLSDQSNSKHQKIATSEIKIQGEKPASSETVKAEPLKPVDTLDLGVENVKKVAYNDLGLTDVARTGGMADSFTPPADWLALQSAFVQEAVKHNVILNDDGIFGVLDEKGVFRTWPNAPKGVSAKMNPRANQ